MTNTINLNVRTQARAYQAGFQDALSLLVDAMTTGGDVAFLIDALEDNANAETREKLNAYYAGRRA